MATEPIVGAPALAIVTRRPLAISTALADYWAMTKPEVNFLIAITTVAAFSIASPAALPHLAWISLLNTLLGTVLVASGAATLNQWMEHPFDARMRRTARRPIAAGRMEPVRALTVGLLLSVGGALHLAATAGVLPALLATATLLGYLLLYTPSKRMTPLCTLIGAIPGAVPPLIGWAAARGRLEPEAWVLFAIVFLWQFPHFMAIAWMYRDDYDRAGYLVLPCAPARSRFVALLTLLPLTFLVPLSLIPFLASRSSALCGSAALLISLGFLHYGVRFAVRRSPAAARQLLAASIIYLPSLLVLIISGCS
jgi:protoheme IX farnesyltransferase